MSLESNSSGIPFEDFTFSVQEKKSDSTNFDSGEDDYYIIIKEPWDWTSNFRCSGSNSPSQPFTTGEGHKLQNKGNGLYSIDMSITEEKEITIGLFKFKQGEMAAQYFNATTNTSFENKTENSLSQNWDGTTIYVSNLAFRS